MNCQIRWPLTHSSGDPLGPLVVLLMLDLKIRDFKIGQVHDEMTLPDIPLPAFFSPLGLGTVSARVMAVVKMAWVRLANPLQGY
jgi:hypothetical protein